MCLMQLDHGPELHETSSGLKGRKWNTWLSCVWSKQTSTLGCTYKCEHGCKRISVNAIRTKRTKKFTVRQHFPQYRSSSRIYRHFITSIGSRGWLIIKRQISQHPVSSQYLMTPFYFPVQWNRDVKPRLTVEPRQLLTNGSGSIYFTQNEFSVIRHLIYLFLLQSKYTLKKLSI